MTPLIEDQITAQAIQGTNFALAPEFVDSKGLRAGFGIPRSLGYSLKDQGVRTICLRKPGATRGKRLWLVSDVRAWLMANIDQRKSDEAIEKDAGKLHNHSPAPQAQPAEKPVSKELEALRAEREQLEKQLAALKQQQRH